MKKTVLTVIMIAGFAAPAFAQDTAALCRLMGAGGPMASGAAYQPGVDAHGRPVVPADGNAGIGSDADTIKIPLSIDLARRLQVPNGAEMEVSGGTIEIHKDGRVTSGNVDLTSRSHAVCGMPDIAPPPPAPVQKVEAPKAPAVPAPPVVAMPAPLPVPAPLPARVNARTSGQTTTMLPDIVTPAEERDPKTYMPRAGSVSSYVDPHSTADEKASDTIKPRDVSKGDTEQSPSRREDLIWGQGN